jgi:PST family polysaccharide transporter
MSLHKKMVHGAFWSLLEKGGQQGLSLIVFLVLARLLGPEEYGLANLCFIFFTLTYMVTTGLVDGIVSHQIDDDLQLSSLFWGILVIGLGITILCLLIAEPLSVFMAEPKLKMLLIWFSVVPLLVALPAVPNLLLLKELAFKVYAIRAIVATFIGGVVGIYMAEKNYGAYAIIGQQIALYIVTNLIIWRAIAWRPRMIFDRFAFLEAIKPGLSVTGFNSLGFLDGQAPRFFIGKILGAEALGYFALAIRLRFSLSEILVTSPLAALYPALAKLRNDLPQQKSIAEALIFLSGLIVFPILAIAVSTSSQYVPLLFGAKWIPVVPVLQIYITGAACLPSLIIMQYLLRANGQMMVYFRSSAFFIAANLMMGLLLFHRNGLIWMACGIFSVTLVSIPYFIFLLHRKMNINLATGTSKLIWPILGSIFGFSVIKIYQSSAIIAQNPYVALFVSCILGVTVYAIFCAIFQYKEIKNMFDKIKKIRQYR